MIKKTESLELVAELLSLAPGHARADEIRLIAEALNAAVIAYHDTIPPAMCGGDFLRQWVIARMLLDEVKKPHTNPLLP